jgi:hypothetical protein
MGDTFHRIHQKLNQTNAKLKTNDPQTGPRTALHKDNKTHEDNTRTVKRLLSSNRLHGLHQLLSSNCKTLRGYLRD